MGNIQSIFPVPIYMDKAEGENFKLIQEELLSITEKIEFSQRKGWNKDTHMLNKDPFSTNFLFDNNCQNTVRFIYESATEYVQNIAGHPDYQYSIIESWITKTLKGQYAHEHHHGATDISGVYYINTNGEDGNLIFDNIHSQMAGNFVFSSLVFDHKLPLENGLLILWPGLLRHRTHVNTTDNERLSLSFNIMIGRKGFVVENG